MAEKSFESQYKRTLGDLESSTEGKFTKRDRSNFVSKLNNILTEVIKDLTAKLEQGLAKETDSGIIEKIRESFDKRMLEFKKLSEQTERRLTDPAVLSGDDGKKLISSFMAILKRADRLRQDINRVIKETPAEAEVKKAILDDLKNDLIKETEDRVPEQTIGDAIEDSGEQDPELERIADDMLRAVGLIGHESIGSADATTTGEGPESVGYEVPIEPIVPQTREARKEYTPQESIQNKINKLEEIDFSKLKYLPAADSLLRQLDNDFRIKRNKGVKFSPADIKKRILEIFGELEQKLAGKEGFSKYEKYLRSKFTKEIEGYQEIRDLSMQYEKLKLAKIKEFFEKYKVNLPVKKEPVLVDTSESAPLNVEASAPTENIADQGFQVDMVETEKTLNPAETKAREVRISKLRRFNLQGSVLKNADYLLQIFNKRYRDSRKAEGKKEPETDIIDKVVKLAVDQEKGMLKEEGGLSQIEKIHQEKYGVGTPGYLQAMEEENLKLEKFRLFKTQYDEWKNAPVEVGDIGKEKQTGAPERPSQKLTALVARAQELLGNLKDDIRIEYEKRIVKAIAPDDGMGGMRDVLMKIKVLEPIVEELEREDLLTPKLNNPIDGAKESLGQAAENPTVEKRMSDVEQAKQLTLGYFDEAMDAYLILVEQKPELSEDPSVVGLYQELENANTDLGNVAGDDNAKMRQFQGIGDRFKKVKESLLNLEKASAPIIDSTQVSEDQVVEKKEVKFNEKEEKFINIFIEGIKKYRVITTQAFQDAGYAEADGELSGAVESEMKRYIRTNIADRIKEMLSKPNLSGYFSGFDNPFEAIMREIKERRQEK
jgi:hypothetical protein